MLGQEKMTIIFSEAFGCDWEAKIVEQTSCAVKTEEIFKC